MVETASSEQSTVDPVTLEVLRGRLDAVASEMEHALLKASYSSIITEAQDATAAVFNAQGQTVAQACALPIHLGALSELGRRFARRFPQSFARPGDLYITNDPYDGGTHLPDFAVAAPVFFGSELVGYVATMTHHQDIGGSAPGSASTDVYDHHSEGLRIPLMLLASGGVVDNDLLALMMANSRTPDNMRGDLYAQVAGCNTGAVRFECLFRDLGIATTQTGLMALMDYSEALTRSAIRKIPNGKYQFCDWLDNAGLADDSPPVKINVTLTVSDTDVEFDFSGTAKQVRAAINNVPSSSLSCVYFAIRTLTGDAAPNNDGCYRPISVHLPTRSIVNPDYPAPVNARGVAICRMVDAVMGAMSKALPERVPAAGCGHANIFLAGGKDDSGRRYTGALGGPLRSGTGARPQKDGIDVADHELSNVFHVPIEVTESEFPVRYEHLGLWTDSGGAGERRGGLGFHAQVHWLEGDAVLSVRGERHKFQPWGAQQGLSSPRCRTEITMANGATVPVPAKVVQRISRGESLNYWSTGGGGFGRPTARDMQKVLDDVRDERVSIEAARDIYGVEIKSGKIVYGASEALRREINEQQCE
jgi:N-methylhydantoinase B/oxoprolinase/acetone carboxylase alpha subunit